MLLDCASRVRGDGPHVNVMRFRREKPPARPARPEVGLAGLLGLMLATLVLACALRKRRRPRPVLYMHPVSAPSRATLSLVRACGLRQIELRQIALERGEHKSEQFLAINPNGSVPALLDGALSIGESHTILRYLVGRFELPDSWYPRELRARARVDEQLDWHHAHSRKGVPFFFHRYVILPFFGGKPDRAAEAVGREAYVRALEFLNAHQLAKRPFVAAEHITIADLVSYAELGPMRFDADLGPRVRALPNVRAWMERMAKQPWHEAVHGEVHALVKRGGGAPALGKRDQRSMSSERR